MLKRTSKWLALVASAVTLLSLTALPVFADPPFPKPGNPNPGKPETPGVQSNGNGEGRHGAFGIVSAKDSAGDTMS